MDYFCDWCGQLCQYNGSDTNTDGEVWAEFWCDNCCEYEYVKVAWVVTDTPADPSATPREEGT